jgi:hypothetical protein
MSFITEELTEAQTYALNKCPEGAKILVPCVVGAVKCQTDCERDH